MSMAVIKIPKTSIDFEIGDKHYTLSLADRTVNQINKEMREIQVDEQKGIQDLVEKTAKYNEQLEDLKAKANIEGISDEEFSHQANILSNRVDRMFQDRSEKSVQIVKEHYIEYLDVCFGKNVGQEIYKMCNESTSVLGKVITEISIALNTEQDVSDYRKKKIKEIEDLQNDSEKSDSIPESTVQS